MPTLADLRAFAAEHLAGEQLLCAHDVERLDTDPRDEQAVNSAYATGPVGVLVFGGTRLVRLAARARRKSTTPPVERRLTRQTSEIVPVGRSTLAVTTDHLLVFGPGPGVSYLGAVPQAEITKIFVDRIGRFDSTRQLSLVFADRSYVSVRHREGRGLEALADALQRPER